MYKSGSSRDWPNQFFLCLTFADWLQKFRAEAMKGGKGKRTDKSQIINVPMGNNGDRQFVMQTLTEQTTSWECIVFRQ